MFLLLIGLLLIVAGVAVGCVLLGFIMGVNKKNQMQYPPCIKNVVDKSRACFPLGFGHASSYVTQGAALIGYFDVIYIIK